MIDFITFCDYTGTFAFAISGIRLASAKQFDWFGAYVVGLVTAVGGGTIRDILLNATPFWICRSFTTTNSARKGCRPRRFAITTWHYTNAYSKL